jgi:hypothetical protein
MQKHLRYEDGVRREEPYYLYYVFFPEGGWICKTIHSPAYGMAQFLKSVDLASIRSEPHLDEPMLDNNELFFQSGTWTQEENMILVEWRNTLAQEEPLFWKFRLRPDGELETEMGEYQLRFTAH